MGNLLSGDATRLTSFGRVKTPRRFIEYPLFIRDIEGPAQRLPAANRGGKGGAR